MFQVFDEPMPFEITAPVEAEDQFDEPPAVVKAALEVLALYVLAEQLDAENEELRRQNEALASSLNTINKFSTLARFI